MISHARRSSYGTRRWAFHEKFKVCLSLYLFEIKLKSEGETSAANHKRKLSRISSYKLQITNFLTRSQILCRVFASIKFDRLAAYLMTRSRNENVANDENSNVIICSASGHLLAIDLAVVAFKHSYKAECHLNDSFRSVYSCS